MFYVLPIVAVLAGFLIVFLLKSIQPKHLTLLLSYSGGFLLSITVFHLLPEVFESPTDHTIGLWIMAGILIQNVLEHFSKGAEHGHVHIKKERSTLPFLLFFSLGLHALLEGFPIHRNESLLAGILVHKIPVAMILSTYLLQTKISRTQVMLFLLAFSLLTPLGSFLSNQIMVLQDFTTQIAALVIGIFLHVSTTILFESNEGHRFNLTKFIVVLLAVGTAYFV